MHQDLRLELARDDEAGQRGELLASAWRRSRRALELAPGPHRGGARPPRPPRSSARLLDELGGARRARPRTARPATGARGAGRHSARLSRAAATGSDLLRWRRSLQAACRSAPARPRCRAGRRPPGRRGRPARRRRPASTTVVGARRPARRRSRSRRRAAHRSSPRASSRPRRASRRSALEAMSWHWPAIIRWVASASSAGGAHAPPGVAALEQHLQRERGERVAGEDCAAPRRRRPTRSAGAGAPVAVHDVVVQQREVVDQLDGDRAGEPPSPRGARAARPTAAPARAARALPPTCAVRVPAEVVVGDRRRPGPAGRPPRAAPARRARASARARRGASRHATAPSRRSAPRRATPRAPPLAAAHRALHRRRPAGVGPRAGEEEARRPGPRAGPQRRVPGVPRNVARGSRVTKNRSTGADRRPGRGCSSAGRNRARSSSTVRSLVAAPRRRARRRGTGRDPGPTTRCGRRPTARACRRPAANRLGDAPVVDDVQVHDRRVPSARADRASTAPGQAARPRRRAARRATTASASTPSPSPETQSLQRTLEPLDRAACGRRRRPRSSARAAGVAVQLLQRHAA